MKLAVAMACIALVGCGRTEVPDEYGVVRTAAVCRRNCPEPEPETPVVRHSVRFARSTGRGAGLYLYRRADSTPNYIDVHTTQGKIATLVVEPPAPGDAATTRRYTVAHGGRVLTLVRQPNIVRVISEWRTPAERAVTVRFNGRGKRFDVIEGSRDVVRENAAQMGVLGAVVEDIGERDLQAINDRAGPAPFLTTPEAPTGTGCLDSAGFCGTEFRTCVPCTGSGGSGTDGSSTPGGAAGGGPTCNGDESVGIGASLVLPLGQMRARTDLDAECNKYNVGCADGCCAYMQPDGKWGPNPEVNCDCVSNAFICACYVFGKSCGEKPLPEERTDEWEYP